MNFNNNQGHKRVYNELRKNATSKTMLLNEGTYKKIDWSKVTIENNLARRPINWNRYDYKKH